MFCKLIVIACTSLITCYLLLMIGDLIIFKSLIIAKGVPFLLLAGRKGGTAQLAWKKLTPFCKILMFK